MISSSVETASVSFNDKLDTAQHVLQQEVDTLSSQLHSLKIQLTRVAADQNTALLGISTVLPDVEETTEGVVEECTVNEATTPAKVDAFRQEASDGSDEDDEPQPLVAVSRSPSGTSRTASRRLSHRRSEASLRSNSRPHSQDVDLHSSYDSAPTSAVGDAGFTDPDNPVTVEAASRLSSASTSGAEATPRCSKLDIELNSEASVVPSPTMPAAHAQFASEELANTSLD